MDFLVLNIIVLFGAVQGFTLCLFLLTKYKENKHAVRNYLLFLFSLSFFNFTYTLLYMGVKDVGGIPITSFPFPYKYLISVGFYFYVKRQIAREHKVISVWENLLFVPAILYGVLRSYWYFRIHVLNEDDLFWNVYQTGFFVYNDFVYLIFGLVIMLFALQFVRRTKTTIKGSVSKLKNWGWIYRFTLAYTFFIVINLLHQMVAISFNLEHSAKFYYVILVLNTIYIYWIGFIGFTKSNLLFNIYQFKDTIDASQKELMQQLEALIKVDEIYTNKNLKISDLAGKLGVSEKELSAFIHETYQLSFSDYLNLQRVEKVKTLLTQSDQDKYTLVAISEQAGFSSKSSFYAVFKKVTGQSPAQFRKSILDK
ncbi:MAG: AraC family transcriptional regulator [Flavobacteriales bacterium]|nr:AraC family transcriptional regulator [Flavobacteriales bacterium]